MYQRHIQLQKKGKRIYKTRTNKKKKKKKRRIQVTYIIGKPVQNVTQYAELAIAVGKVLKLAFSTEIYMRPAISYFGMKR